MNTLPPIKRGDTFELKCFAKNSEGVLEDLSNTQIKCQLRIAVSGKLVAALDVYKADQATNPGQFFIRYADTKRWPATRLAFDIEKSVDGTVVSADSVEFTVVKDVTK